MKPGHWICAALCGLALIGSSTEVHGLSYGFERVTANGAVNVEDQFTLSLTSSLANEVSFKLENSGQFSSVVTAIYLDDASGSDALISEIGSLWGSAGVQFQLGSSPQNMPGGSPVGFTATAGLTASAITPTAHNGVGPGEWVAMNVQLNPSVSVQEIHDALGSGILRFGMHVQSLPDGNSDSFVNLVVAFGDPDVVIPPHETVLVPEGGSAIAFLGFSFIALQVVRKKFWKDNIPAS